MIRIIIICLLVTLTPLYGNRYVPNQLIINFTLPQQNPLSARQTILSQYPISHLTPIRTIIKTADLTTASTRGTTQSTLFLATLSQTEDIPNLCRTLEADPNIRFVQPNYIYTIAYTPNDPDYKLHHWNIGIESFWDNSQGSTDIITAVIDTGIDIDHPDLSQNIWKNEKEIWNNIDDDNNGYIDDVYGWNFIIDSNNPRDDLGHGTHVAGIISAVGNNSIGISGVNPKGKLLALKAGDSNGELTSATITEAIAYAVQQNANILNLSFGTSTKSAPDTVIEKSVETALENPDIIIIAAAGNFGVDIDSDQTIPAIFNNVIAVSSVKIGNGVILFDSDYSNFGNSIDLAAPGTNILSTYYTESLGHTYKYDDGTSMAAPFVSGIAGLLKAVSPSANRTTISEALFSGATDLGDPGKDPYYGYGLVNANNALLALDKEPPQITAETVTSINVGRAFTLQATITDDIITDNLPEARCLLRYNNAYNSTDFSEWKEIPMTRIENNTFQANLDSIPTLSDIQYYFEATDLITTHNIRFPEEITTVLTAQTADLEAPTFTNTYQDNDFLSEKDTLQINIQDNFSLNDNSIVVELTSNDNTQQLDISSPALSFSNNTLSIDLTALTLKDSLVMDITIADNNQNIATTNLSFQLSQDTSFRVFGPEGEGSSILNLPNPFSAQKESTKICFQSTKSIELTMTLYSLRLKPVKQFSGTYFAGYHEIEWDGRDNNGNHVPRGVYMLMLDANHNGDHIFKQHKIAVIN